jgi:hypothetical protein
MCKTIRLVGCAALLSACLAGIHEPAFAQATTPTKDPAKQEQATKAIKAYISFLADEGSSAANDEACERLKFWIRRLSNFLSPFEIDEYARKTYGVILRPIGQPDLASPLADYAGVLHYDLARQYLKICGPPQDEEDETETEISFGGGASSVWVPTIPIGTQIVGGEETSVAKTEEQLDGGSFKAELKVGTRNIWYTASLSELEADGSSRGSVAPGGNDVAITFPVPNPENDSTGIFLADRGLDVSTRTDFRMTDLSAGFGGQLNIFPSFLQGNAFIGARYINLDRTDKIAQTTPAFDDLFMNTRINQDTNFFGPKFGLTIDNTPPPRGGFTYGASGSISLLGSDTSANVRSLVNCGPCGAGSPDFDVTLRANLDDATFSVAVDGGSMPAIASDRAPRFGCSPT